MNGEATEDPVLQRKIADTRDLLSHVKEVRWRSDAHGEYLEFQFPDDFDFSCFTARDGEGRRHHRIGRIEHLKVLDAFEWVQVRFFGTDGEQFGHESVTVLMRSYKKRHGGVASTANIVRVTIPPNVHHIVLARLALDGKEKYWWIGNMEVGRPPNPD